MTDEELDRINRAEEIQRYTENRCEALEKENKKLKEENKTAKEILKQFVVWADWQGANCPSFDVIKNEAKQFLEEVEK